MSFSQADLLNAITTVWSASKKLETRSLYSIMILMICFFDKLPYFAEKDKKDKPEKVELLKFILIEKYLDILHDEDLINMFVSNMFVTKKSARKEAGFYKSVFGTITEIRKLMLKIRYEPPFNYDQLEQYKSIIFYLKTKLKLCNFIDRKNVLLYSLIRNKIIAGEGRLGRIAILMPLEFMNTLLLEGGYHSSAISLNNYPSMKEVSFKTPDKICQSLWLYSLYQRNQESMVPSLETPYVDVRRSFDSIHEYLCGIGELIDGKWYHQDFMINFLAMKYQLLALETYLENTVIVRFTNELKKYELLKKSQKLYRQLEKSAIKVAKEIHESKVLVCKNGCNLKATLEDNAFETFICVYCVKANPKINPIIECFVRLDRNDILWFNVYISDNYGKFREYLKGISELVGKYKEKLIVAENFDQELFAIF